MSIASSSTSSSRASSDASGSSRALPIQGLTPEDLTERVRCSITTARKVVASVHQRGFVDELGVRVPKMALRREVDAIAASHRVGKLLVVAREASSLDPFVKYVLECEDSARIETVRIPLEKAGRFVACVSSQVGCAL